MSIAALVKIDDAGYHFADYPTVLEYYKSQYRSVYGDDVYLEADSQDGQWLAIEAQAAYDLMALGASIYNAFSPATARGVGLSRVVKTNGIRRRVATYSSVPLDIVGQAGTVINNGQAKDNLEQKWNLPAEVVIPPGGFVKVTATATEKGAIAAAAGTITSIATPTLGWQTVTNATAAVEGVAVERDAELRRRQTASTNLPALTPLGAMLGALENLTGVIRVKVYENYKNVIDANGIPGKSECVVIEGGDLDEIARTIGQKKTPGADTYGTTTKTYADPKTGIEYDINFFLLTEDTVKVVVTGTALGGFTTKTKEAIQQEIAAYINGHEIGEGVEYSGLWAPAYLNMPARVQPYRINALTMAIGEGVQGTDDLPIAFNRAARCTPADVTVNIV